MCWHNINAARGEREEKLRGQEGQGGQHVTHNSNNLLPFLLYSWAMLLL